MGSKKIWGRACNGVKNSPSNDRNYAGPAHPSCRFVGSTVVWLLCGSFFKANRLNIHKNVGVVVSGESMKKSPLHENFLPYQLVVLALEN